MTSSLSPTSVTSVVRSSRHHGESRLLIRVHNCVSPMSSERATLTSPARAASLSAIGIASSRLPRRMSTVGTTSGKLGDDFVDVRWEEVDHPARPERDLAQGCRGADSQWFEEVSGAAHGCKGMCRWGRGRNGHDGPVTVRFKAILFDAGGVLVLPDPTVLGPLLAYYGGDPSVEAHRRAHYAGMAAKSAAGSGEGVLGRVRLLVRAQRRVPEPDVEAAVKMLHLTRNPYLWRWAIPESFAALKELALLGVPLGVVSNASGQIDEVLSRSGVCQVGDGPNVCMRIVVDSHLVGVAKPDPRIFDHALPHFDSLEPDQIAYVGDSVTLDIAAAVRRDCTRSSSIRTTITPGPTSSACAVSWNCCDHR